MSTRCTGRSLSLLLREGGCGDSADYLSDVLMAPLAAPVFKYHRQVRGLALAELVEEYEGLVARGPRLLAMSTVVPGSVDEVAGGLRAAGYLPGESTALVSYLATRLGKPVLVEGPAGVGKTELAKKLAEYLGRELVRLQCYEGLDEAKAMYEWNYRKQLLQIQTEADGTGWEAVQDDIFGEEFLLSRPLLQAIASPESGRPAGRRDRQDRPGVRGDAARAAERLPDLDPGTGPDRGPDAPGRAAHVQQLARAHRGVEAPLPVPLARLPDRRARARDRAAARAGAAGDGRAAARRGRRGWCASWTWKKPPSIAESIDWARALLLLGAQDIDQQTFRDTMSIIVKHRTDLDTVAERVGVRLAA